MTAPRTLQRTVGIIMLVTVVALYWLIAKACDLASPRLKWFVIPAMLAVALLALSPAFLALALRPYQQEQAQEASPEPI